MDQQSRTGLRIDENQITGRTKNIRQDRLLHPVRLPGKRKMVLHGEADLNTQFYKGYNYPDKSHYISKFFAPAYSNISLGMDFRPKSNYSLYLSPIAGKLTFVEDDYLSNEGAFGVDPGDRFRAEIGAYIKAKAEQKIMENVNLITSVDFFTPYDKQFGNVDVNWDVLINMKINKYLSATLNTTLKYDNDVKTFNVKAKNTAPKFSSKRF